ncbi:c-type cytochrome [Flavobacterium caeni]|uniref:Cytochrome c n=1 Tax=Flavobacterium caeni TaxID=490189 RepID=A0A1G5DXH7_9FLAO|nr:c-type cytochrome [Flavobacterium caeni]SCY18898.1 cytochrome c [Flavobacterium caeni]
MKQTLFTLSTAVLLWSCAAKDEKKDVLYPESASTEKKSPEEFGKELFESTGNCFACHQPDQKIIGPSIEQIARIYKDQNGDMVSFLKGNEKPLVDPDQFSVMQTNFAITKKMSDEELKALEAYIYSHLK